MANDDNFNNIPIEEVFQSAVSIVRNLPKEGTIKPSDDLKLKLYAYFKQATQGLNDTPKPRFYQLVELYKWDAWKKLANMPKEDAMRCYIEELRQIMKTIPVSKNDIEDNKHFEDVLGKKFYDYWFSQFNRQQSTSPDKQQQQQQVVEKDKISTEIQRFPLVDSSLQNGNNINHYPPNGNYDINYHGNNKNNNNNVNHNHISNCNKISNIYDDDNTPAALVRDEETQSIKSDGYKTPSVSAFKGICCDVEICGQFTGAVLRLGRALQIIESSSHPISYSNKYTSSKISRVRFNTDTLLSKYNYKTANRMTTPVAFDTNCMTLTRFLIEEQRKYPTATGELTTLLNALQTAIKSVSSAVRKAGMTNLFGLANEVNVQGEEVKRLDVLSNELFINMLKSSYTTYTMISEENEQAIKIEEDKAGKYMIAFDPLDGSSNIEASVSIGSIFAIYKPTTDRASLPTGRSIVAAGYALYGSATVIVLAINAGAHFFMLDPAIGEFILTEPNFRVKPRGNIYSVNEGYHSKWDDAMRNYVQNKKYPKEAGQKPYSSRYVGSMVADLHRTFKYGGIFMYPRTKDAKNGKLRLLYECNPMAFIAEKAGGKAMAGPDLPILDVQPSTIHERTPIFIGSVEDVDEIMAEYVRLKLS